MPRLLLGVLLATTSFACDATKAPVSPGRVSAAVTTSTTSTAPPSPVQAQYVFSPRAPTTGQDVRFDASGSTAGPGRKITSYSWDFGDGVIGVGVTDGHAYAVAGTYSVILTVTDDASQRASKSEPITVAPGFSTTSASLQYVNAQVPKDTPSDITVALQATGPGTFDARGTFNTASGIAGLVRGVFTGILPPQMSGNFVGSLTSDVERCTAEARFSGPMGQNQLTWSRAEVVSDCGGSPLSTPAFATFTLLQTQQPPRLTTTTTSIASTTTTSSPTTSSVPPVLSLTVRVIDGGGGAIGIKNVKVSVTSLGSGGVVERTTNAEGVVFVNPLDPGQYVVSVVPPFPVPYDRASPPGSVTVTIDKNQAEGVTVTVRLDK